MGLFGGGNSSSNQTTNQTTNNVDKRVAVQDGVGISGNWNRITETNNITDGGIVSRGLGTVDSAIGRSLGSVDTALTRSMGTVDKAIESIGINNATNAQGFEKLLGAAESLWNKGESLIGQTQKSVADAYVSANTDAKGSIDNKTIIVLAVAGAAAFAFARRKG